MYDQSGESQLCATGPTDPASEMRDVRPLVTPNQLADALPVTAAAARTVSSGRRAIARILRGDDTGRLVVIAGPCSIHDPDAAIEYAERLARVAATTAETLVVVMRTYFEKPRTALGWKGFLNDPDIDGSCDLLSGLERSRTLLREINGLGVACGSELLDPTTPHFIADLLAWAGIGARTSSSQTHREMASGLTMPVGFKNAMDGDPAVAVNAMISAASPHTLAGMSRNGSPARIRTRGNPDSHIVLRGGTNGPNFSRSAVTRAADTLGDLPPARRIMVDCSHGNSNKDHRLQGFVCREVLKQVRTTGHPIMGLMLESHLRPGRQTYGVDAKPHRGVSITDACIGWDETEDLLNEISEAIKLGL